VGGHFCGGTVRGRLLFCSVRLGPELAILNFKIEIIHQCRLNTAFENTIRDPYSSVLECLQVPSVTDNLAYFVSASSGPNFHRSVASKCLSPLATKDPA
jgi:hypothetical protein